MDPRKKLRHPKVAVLIIGAEILSAKVTDANGPFLLNYLRQIGLHSYEVRIIDDSAAQIIQAIAQLRSQVEIILTAGGIGPTHDDITLVSVAKALNRNVVVHPELHSYLCRYHRQPLTTAVLKMAEVPEGSIIYWDTAKKLPVICVDNMYLLPGIPTLLQKSMAVIAPYFQGDPFYNETLYFQVQESILADVLETLQHQFTDLTIGSYPQTYQPNNDLQFKNILFDGEYVKVTIDGSDVDQILLAKKYLEKNIPKDWFLKEAIDANHRFI